MRICIVGGTGNITTSVVRQLLEPGHDVTCFNRGQRGKVPEGARLICGDGHAIHQFLHVDDAARAMVGMMGQRHCVGQTYNLVQRGFTTWKAHHETVMRMLGREVELIGVSCRDLEAFDVPAREICMTIFAFNCYYSSEKLFADVPTFTPMVSLSDGLRDVYDVMGRDGRIPASEPGGWEDQIVERVRASRSRG